MHRTAGRIAGRLFGAAVVLATAACGGGGGGGDGDGGGGPPNPPPAPEGAVYTLTFLPATIELGDAAELRIGVENPNDDAALNGLSFSLDYPNGLSNRLDEVANNGCSAQGERAAAGVSISGIDLSAGESCVVLLPVGADAAGSYSLSHAGASATLTVAAADTPPPATSGAISGTITIPAGTAVDGDTANPEAPLVSNDETPQPVPNPVTLGGHVACPAGSTGEDCLNAGTTDAVDYFAVALAPGQLVNLYLAEDGFANDLDLYLIDGSFEVVAESFSTSNRETVSVPAAGARYIAVAAWAGASNYVLTASSSGEAAHALRSDADFLPGEALVSYEGGLRAAGKALPQAVVALGAERLMSLPGRFDRLRLGATLQKAAWQSPLGRPYAGDALARKAATLHAIKRLQHTGGVAAAWPNMRVRAYATPNDSYYSDQWHYRLIDAPAAWDLTTGASSVLAAVIDTGVLLGHPDLQGQFDDSDPDGYDFVSSVAGPCDGDGRDGNALDPGRPGIGGTFHGTHVAGTIAALSDNGSGVAGVSWQTSLMPIRVLGCEGTGSIADIVNGMLYAAGLDNASGTVPARRADVMNLSLGCTDCYSAQYQAVIDDIRDAGTIIVAAAGNDGTTQLSYPASYDGVVSVGAVGPESEHAPYSQSNGAVDVAAPGGDQVNYGLQDGGVLSTYGRDSSGDLVYGYGFLQGTSMATPHVAGVVALMKAVNPGLTPAQLDNLLAEGGITTDLGASGRDDQYGYGIINAAAAVRAAGELAGGDPAPETPLLAVSPESLSFGMSTTALSLTARNAGSGSLSIDAVSDDADWLTVSVAASTPDAIVYTVNVDRNGLGDGSYSATIRFDSSANDLEVPVLMRVGSSAGDAAADAGLHYILLIDPDSGETVAQAAVSAQDGAYTYHLSDLAAGHYFVAAGTDNDNDGFICDGGEACGAYPTLGSYGQIEIEVGADGVDGIDFGTGYSGAIVAETGAQAAGKSGKGFRGFALRPPIQPDRPMMLEK